MLETIKHASARYLCKLKVVFMRNLLRKVIGMPRPTLGICDSSTYYYLWSVLFLFFLLAHWTVVNEGNNVIRLHNNNNYLGITAAQLTVIHCVSYAYCAQSTLWVSSKKIGSPIKGYCRKLLQLYISNLSMEWVAVVVWSLTQPNKWKSSSTWNCKTYFIPVYWSLFLFQTLRYFIWSHYSKLRYSKELCILTDRGYKSQTIKW